MWWFLVKWKCWSTYLWRWGNAIRKKEKDKNKRDAFFFFVFKWFFYKFGRFVFLLLCSLDQSRQCGVLKKKIIKKTTIDNSVPHTTSPTQNSSYSSPHSLPPFFLSISLSAHSGLSQLLPVTSRALMLQSSQDLLLPSFFLRTSGLNRKQKLLHKGNRFLVLVSCFTSRQHSW